MKLKPIAIFITTSFIISSVQWASIHFMVMYCSQWGLAGLFKNIFSLGSPVCTFINHVQVALADYYITIWASTASFLIMWATTTRPLGKKVAKLNQ